MVLCSKSKTVASGNEKYDAAPHFLPPVTQDGTWAVNLQMCKYVRIHMTENVIKRSLHTHEMQCACEN